MPNPDIALVVNEVQIDSALEVFADAVEKASRKTA